MGSLPEVTVRNGANGGGKEGEGLGVRAGGLEADAGNAAIKRRIRNPSRTLGIFRGPEHKLPQFKEPPGFIFGLNCFYRMWVF